MSNWKLLKKSPFVGTYGVLELYQDEEGNYFLRMDDVNIGSEFGPLTDKQVEAFMTLCDVPEYDA